MTASVFPAADLKSVRCPRCGSAFDCGRDTQPFECWCKSLPALPASEVDPRGRCLCPECLAAAAAGAAAAHPAETGGPGGFGGRSRGGAPG